MMYTDKELKLIKQFLKDLESIKKLSNNKRFNQILRIEVAYEHIIEMEKDGKYA